jgi:hypothetical protein
MGGNNVARFSRAVFPNIFFSIDEPRKQFSYSKVTLPVKKEQRRILPSRDRAS